MRRRRRRLSEAIIAGQYSEMLVIYAAIAKMPSFKLNTGLRGPYWGQGRQINVIRISGEKNTFRRKFALLSWANIDIIRQVWSKYLIERKTMSEGGVELSQENY